MDEFTSLVDEAAHLDRGPADADSGTVSTPPTAKWLIAQAVSADMRQ